MPFPHTLLTLSAAATCWLAASMWTAALPSGSDLKEGSNPLGIRRSAYGSLIARLMKDSLHSYWHAGRKETAAEHEAEVSMAGRLHHHDHHDDEHHSPLGTPAHHSGSWIEAVTQRLSELEDLRTTPTSQRILSLAHRRYLEATANWHLRVAYRLDPGDAALYEILHYTAMSRASSPEAARKAAEELARQTIEHALSPQGGLSASLTGAGAAINLLNNQLQPGAAIPATPAHLLHNWEMLNTCLNRYRQLRQEAAIEGWWNAIPQTRKNEIKSYADLLEKLSDIIGKKLSAMGVITPSHSP